MQKVIAVNLNGNAYQVEEQGYDALVAYLARAGTTLETNPDRTEILADLEQAIAEKSQKYLGPNKTVVSFEEMDRILGEMGPVESGTTPSDASANRTEGDEAGSEDKEKKTDAGPGAAKRLYQIREGAMLSGVCNGLAAYLNLDVTLVRVGFVILAVLTNGVWLLVYAVLSFVIPFAKTSEERAAARGRPFTAKDLIEQAKTNYATMKNEKDWKRHWRQQRRQWRQQVRGIAWEHRWAPANVPEQVGYAAQVWGGITAPVFGLIDIVLAIALAFSFISVVTRNEVFGYALPPGVPAWAWILLLLVCYQVIASPIKFARRAAWYPAGPSYAVVFAPFIGLAWIAVLLVAGWWAYEHLPQVQDVIQRIPEIWDRMVQSNR
jgi:phage shock protein PspC (stress-responsive transcriptional regulator)